MTASTYAGSLGTFPGRDGLELAYRWTGEGRPLVLLHGFTGSGLQFLQHGPAAALASHGYRVIVPDLRGHGDSARPHDPAAYPPDVLADVLADDGLALIDFLQLRDYDLGGPTSRTGGHRRALTAIVSRDRLDPGSPEAMQADWLAQSGADPQALLHVLDTFVETPGTVLAEITTLTLVMAGDQDERQAEEPAAVLAHEASPHCP